MLPRCGLLSEKHHPKSSCLRRDMDSKDVNKKPHVTSCGLMALDKLVSEEWLWSSAPAMQHIKQDNMMSIFEAVSFKCRMFAKWVLKSNYCHQGLFPSFCFDKKNPSGLMLFFFTMQTHQLQAKMKPNSLKGV